MTAAPAYGSSTVKRIRRTNMELEALDNAIIEAVTMEHPVTLRGVYYRVVSAGAVDKTEAGYRLIGRQLLKLRRSGAVPYSWITDGTRWITKPETHDSVEQMLADAAASYRRALWHDQPVDIHIFAEKDAVSGVLMPVIDEWDVPLGVLRGYSSESFAHSVAEALAGSLRRGKEEVYVYQLGDHDPSGLDAWRAFTTTVRGFLEGLAPFVIFERIAVTEAQIVELALPTRPTKRSDTRAASFTGESVEVDAIPPSYLRGLLSAAIEQHIDPEKLRITRSVEASERDVLRRIAGAA